MRAPFITLSTAFLGPCTASPTRSSFAPATATGFYDQAHLTRHFRRMLSTTPGAYARSA